ncbi:cysteine hydrolase family protein [Pleomorphovibrio marinus]|uniref:isochorismatase family protein n=1 Tax=Pleomorphovibrio marinus TaxID=2164132 RepID=UPI000E0C9967|nr:isochorismatase family protein [Pleomorphovibrio marinus]
MKTILLFPLLFAMLLSDAGEEELLNLTLRSRVMSNQDSWNEKQEQVSWEASSTAIIVTDMWNKHWCESASDRVAELAPHMEEVIGEARKRGVTIIHAPSGTMDFYKDFPQRKKATQVPYHRAPANIAINDWCYLDPEREGALPIDDSDGGCDQPCANGEPCEEKSVWTRQIDLLSIKEDDFITDNGQEVFNILSEQEIENVIIMGVHINMCVLGRPFAIRQMNQLGKNVVLMRDMTDAMYNPEMPPYVNHFKGVELVVAHIEKYWAPTVLSSDITGKPAFKFKDDK